MALRSLLPFAGHNAAPRIDETLKTNKSRARTGHSLGKQLIPSPSPLCGVGEETKTETPGSNAGGSTIVVTDEDTEDSQTDAEDDDLSRQLLSSMVWFGEHVVGPVLNRLIDEVRETTGYPALPEDEDYYYTDEEEDDDDDDASFISEITSYFQEYEESNGDRIASRTISRSLISGAFEMPEGLEVKEESVVRARSLGSGISPSVVRSLGTGAFPSLPPSASGTDSSTQHGTTSRDGRLFGETCLSRLSPRDQETECDFALKALGIRNVTSRQPLDDPFPFDTEDERQVTERCTPAVKLLDERSRRTITIEQEEQKVSDDPILGMTIQYTVER